MKDRQVPGASHAKQHQASRKRPRGNTLSSKAGHVCASVLVLAFVQCSSASQSGGGEGSNYGQSSSPRGQVTRGENGDSRHSSFYRRDLPSSRAYTLTVTNPQAQQFGPWDPRSCSRLHERAYVVRGELAHQLFARQPPCSS